MNRSTYDSLKRAIDISASGVGLILTAPLIGATAAVIALTMGRPVFFTQDRPGKGGKIFQLVKFRSMLPHDSHQVSDEERLTPLGRFIRATSIDELPSLWNVLKGDMSLVGPRPLHVHYLDLYSPYHQRRHEVRPGITGLAQVSGRNQLEWSSRFDLDVDYVDHRCLALDLKILAKTIMTTLKRDGISAQGHATMPAFTGYHGQDSRG